MEKELQPTVTFRETIGDRLAYHICNLALRHLASPQYYSVVSVIMALGQEALDERMK